MIMAPVQSACRNLLSQRIVQQCAPSSFLSRYWSSKVAEGELQALTPVPDRDYKRKAVIYKPSGPAGQFGYNVKEMHGGGISPWKVSLPTQEMWTNPLMGWAASSDTSESSFRKMTFKSAEDAAEFLKKQGIPFEIEEKPENWDSTYRPSRYAQYGDNFSTKRSGVPDLSHLPSNNKK